MDDDELRRGMPTSHVKFGENVAILAGDGAVRRGDAALLRAPGGRPRRVLAALGELIAATGVDGMVGGQYIDVIGRRELDAEGLRRMHALKTGRLIGAERRRRARARAGRRT